MTSTNGRLSMSSMASAENSDVITCKTLLDSLGDQLQAQMDINSDYMLFQTKVERQKNSTLKLSENVSSNIYSVKNKWEDFIDRTLELGNTFVKEIEKNSKFGHGSTEVKKIQNVSEATKLIRPKHEDLLQDVAQLKYLTESIDTFHANTRKDQRRLSLIETKNEKVKKLDTKIANVLEREIRNVEKIKAAAKNEERMYGIWELTSGYKQLLRHLGTTIDDLESVTTESDEVQTYIPAILKEFREFNILALFFKRLALMLQAEITNNNNNIYGNNNEASEASD
uniref:Uncharacterized protein n=1 Tax=Panagrolaimus sp. ES5 TaxID=591445 RepID=A0AC34F4Z0_9BILA